MEQNPQNPPLVLIWFCNY